MTALVAFGFMGVIATKAVDLVRHFFDKNERVPKGYWVLGAWVIGIGEALIVTNQPQLQHWLGIDPSTTVDQILVGIGFGSVGSFWHELLSMWSSKSSASTPQGFKLKSAA